MSATHLARQLWCILITIIIIFVAEMVAASLLILFDHLLQPSGTPYSFAAYYPWGSAIGETAGGMMGPAIMLCVFALFRYTTVFAGLALFCCPGYAYLVYSGSVTHASDGVAMFHAISALVGSAAAIPVVVLRMRGRWKS